MREGNAKTLASLTAETLEQGLSYLTERDADLAQILKTLGPPPLWQREAGFATLLQIILEQQVSLASARAAFQRLLAAVSPLTPERFLRLDDIELKQIGFSRQKSRYGRELAQALLESTFDLDALHRLEDEAVRQALMALKGIGRWTADIYLLMALMRPRRLAERRPGLSLALAVQRLKGLPARPTPAELEQLADLWRPYRAVAARLLWHDYLHGRRI